METLWADSKLNKQINIWWYIARVIPIFALVVLAIVYLLDIKTLTDWFMISVVSCFIFASISWWWWVMVLVKNINTSMQQSINKFQEISNEIKEIKKDIKNVRDR